MTIRILSLDFDGCLFHKKFIEEKLDLIEANVDFLDQIKQENKSLSHVHTFVGSNRQSNATDRVNQTHGKGSCFPAVKRISEHLGTTLDKFLLADIYGDLPDGTSFNRAMDENYKEDHSPWAFDFSKVTILYAQMHKIAIDHPNKKIQFDFYDDLDEILNTLHVFYSKNTDLMPSNVTLRLHHYAGETINSQRKEIKGTGFIDSNYRQTIKEMADLDGVQSVDNYSRINATRIDVELLQNRKPLFDSQSVGVEKSSAPQPIEPAKPVEPVEPAKPVVQPTRGLHSEIISINLDVHQNTKKQKTVILDPKAVSNFIQQLKALEAKTKELLDNDFNKAADSASLLHTTLNTLFEHYSKNEISPEDFKERCEEALSEARKELETHRGWKKVLANVGLAVFGLVGLYLVAGLANLAITGGKHFFFQFNTDSANKINELEKTVDELVPSVSA